MEAHHSSKIGFPPARSGARCAARLLLLPFAVFLGGCGGSNLPSITEGNYEGPPLSIDQSGRAAVVFMEAPTPAWGLTLHRTSQARDHWQAFVTVRRPDPSYMYAQMIVRQNLLTTVESRQPLRVYARILDFADQATDGEYREAARAPGASPEAPKSEAPPPKP